MFENQHIMSAVSQNLLWYYRSYDYQKAVEYLLKKHSIGFGYTQGMPSNCIPNDVKRLFEVWRIGKLRTMRLSNNGMIQRLHIGKKYVKSFWYSELGHDAKPIFETKYQDQYGLVDSGVAVTINQIRNNLTATELKYYEKNIEI